MRGERCASGTTFVGAGFYGGPPEPSVGEFMVWGWGATYFGVMMVVGCFFCVLFVQFFAIHVRMWSNTAALSIISSWLECCASKYVICESSIENEKLT